MLYERAIVALVAEKVEEIGMSHSEFGRRIFGEESGVRLWRKCRESTSPRKLVFSEAYKIAELFDLDLPTMLWQFSQEAQRRGML